MVETFSWDDSRLSEHADAAIKLFRKEHQTKVSPYHQLKLDWPDAEHSLRVLFSYISAGLIDEEQGRPLIYMAACDALDAHNKAVLETRTDPLRMIIFLRVLLQTALPRLTTIRVVSAKGDVWRANQPEPLTEWATRQGPGLKVEDADALPYNEVYAAVVGHAITERQASVIKAYYGNPDTDIVEQMKALDDPE